MAIAHLAGDPDLFGDRHKPNGMLLREDFAGIDEEARDEILSTALRVLSDYRDGRTPAAWRPDDEQLRAMLRFASGGDIGDEYLPMMIGELNLEGTDGYGIEWQERPPAESLEKFQVLVIGAGMSGICAAYRLKEAGIPYVVVEKNPAVGGTWYENSYPGCKVDVPNHFYSYSFETQTDCRSTTPTGISSTTTSSGAWTTLAFETTSGSRPRWCGPPSVKPTAAGTLS